MNSVPSCSAGGTDKPQRYHRGEDGEFLPAHHPGDDRTVDPDQDPAHGISVLGSMRPRTNSSISTGTSVIESSAAPAMAKVLV